MEGNGSQLSDKQRRAINALLSEPTAKQAAVAAQVGETTLYRWLNEPSFSAVLKESRERVFESTLAALQCASGKAVETLRTVMDDTTAQASARVSAAKCVLDTAIRAREQLELSERMRLIEEQLSK